MKLRCISFFIFATAVLGEYHIRRRVPNFIGVRGKKNQLPPNAEFSAYEENCLGEDCIIDDTMKLTPSKRIKMGFQGVRGRKRPDASSISAMDFMGIKPKKLQADSLLNNDFLDVDDYWFLNNELAKRKFYGMRGKKLPYSFNMMGISRGKKGPSATAFIGMRGKKRDPNFSDLLIGSLSKENYNSPENLAGMIRSLSADQFQDSRSFADNDIGNTDFSQVPGDDNGQYSEQRQND